MTRQTATHGRDLIGAALRLSLPLLILGGLTQALEAGHRRRGPCVSTARAAFRACRYDARDDFWETIGNCHDIDDEDEREECFEEAEDEFRENSKHCCDQYEARREVCELAGPGVYDPEIDPEDFVDFEAVIEEGEDFELNPYFPLTPGTKREYVVVDEDDEIIERILVEVLEKTKEIEGVNCIVVRDRVWEVDEEGEEELIEDTDDWLAQNSETGDVWYFGELAKDYEDGELVSLDGSFEAGVDFAKAGIWVLASPEAGDFYRQEFALAEAEDVALVVSVGEETVEVPAGTFSEGVLQTKDWNPLEPDGFEYKFYAPGTGLVMELDPESGERLILIGIVNP